MDDLSDVIAELTGDTEPIPEFREVAYYDRKMDCLMYLNEDTAYRAERISGLLTVLWSQEDEDKLVGLKLKGFGWLYGKAVESGALGEEQFGEFIRWLELALYESAKGMMEEYLMAGQRELAPRVRQIVQSAKIPDEEFAPLRAAA